MKKLLLLLPMAALLSGCQFYQPGNISQKVFGGIGSDDSILSVPTPYGRAIRVSGASTNDVIIHPDGTVIKVRKCNHEKAETKPQVFNAVPFGVPGTMEPSGHSMLSDETHAYIKQLLEIGTLN